MRKVWLWGPAVFLLVLAIFPPVFGWHSCTKCLGIQNAQTDTEFKGTTGSLTWKSVQRLEHVAVGPVPEYRCYERGVTNESLRTVTEVFWDIAAFWKDKIHGKTPACDVMTIPGSLAKPDPAGPLFVGPSRAQRIDTQVYAPLIGWPQRRRALPAHGAVVEYSPILAGRTLILGNGVSFPVETAQFAASATVSMTSEVTFVGDRSYRYVYIVTHDGVDPILLQWHIVNDGTAMRDAHKDFVLADYKPIRIAPGKPLTFTLYSTEPPKWGIGPVVVTDLRQQPLAAGVASSYGPRKGAVKDAE